MSKMLPRTMLVSGLTVILLFTFTLPAVPQEETLPPQQNANANQEAPEVLTRGPVHEAFAEQINNNPKPGVLVPKAPPELIGEVPPEYKPEGENVLWIPGYWFWDDERQDYIWISGVWRVPPQDRRWVSGYWHREATGYHWISGFWISTAQDTVQYQQQPPLSIENGPTSPAPDENHFWVPGCWRHRTSYQWRPGYWRPFRANWIWIPAHYVWTPRGSVFVDGYWDYRMPYRGQLFAPVYIPHHHHRQVHYRYSPSCVINLGSIGLHLFVRPSYHHYYFGDYYGSTYSSRNFFATFNYHRSGFGCDPFLTYYQWHFGRQGINYTHRLRQSHRYLDHHQHHRPPRTLHSQTNIIAHQNNRTNVNINVLGRHLRDVARDTQAGQKVVHLATQQRTLHQHKSDVLRNFRTTRREHEQTGDDKVDQLIAQRGLPAKPAAANPHRNHRHKDLTLPPVKSDISSNTTANVGPQPKNPTTFDFKTRAEQLRQKMAAKKAPARTPTATTKPPTSALPVRAPGKITRPAVGSDRATANVGPLPSKPTVSSRLPKTPRITRTVPAPKPKAASTPVPTRTRQQPMVNRGTPKTTQPTPSRAAARVTPKFPARPSFPATKRSTFTPTRLTPTTRSIPSSPVKKTVPRNISSSPRAGSTRSVPVRKSSTPASSPRPAATRSSNRGIVGPLPSSKVRSSSPRPAQPRTRATTPRSTVRPPSKRSTTRSPSTPKPSFSIRKNFSIPNRKSFPRTSPSPQKK